MCPWKIQCSGRRALSALGLCSRHWSWLQHELKLPGNELPRLTAGAGFAGRDVVQRHGFQSISSTSFTTTENHAGSELLHSSSISFLLVLFLWVSGCKVSWCVCDPQLCCLVVVHLPFFPACILPGHSGQATFVVVLGGTEEGPSHLPRICSQAGNTTMSFARGPRANVKWWRWSCTTKGLKCQLFPHNKRDGPHLFWSLLCAQSQGLWDEPWQILRRNSLFRVIIKNQLVDIY